MEREAALHARRWKAPELGIGSIAQTTAGLFGFSRWAGSARSTARRGERAHIDNNGGPTRTSRHHQQLDCCLVDVTGLAVDMPHVIPRSLEVPQNFEKLVSQVFLGAQGVGVHQDFVSHEFVFLHGFESHGFLSHGFLTWQIGLLAKSKSVATDPAVTVTV